MGLADIARTGPVSVLSAGVLHPAAMQLSIIVLAAIALLILPNPARAADPAAKPGAKEKAVKAVGAAGRVAGKAADAAADVFYSLPLANQAADQRAAQAAVARKEALPLDVILGKVTAAHPGDVVDVDFEREDGRWVYEIKLIEPAGSVLEVDVEASSGAILKSRRSRF